MIVRLMGGLGNQLFQFAFGISTAAARKESVVFSWQDQARPYGLGAYNVDAQLFRVEMNPVIQEPRFSYSPEVLMAPPGSTFIGYWQSERYFNEPLVRRAIKLRDRASDESFRVAEKIWDVTGASVFLHVRRGDYLQASTNAYHGMPTMNYYNEAIRNIQDYFEDAKFFVFSDEPAWCRTVFPASFVIVDHNMDVPHEDLWLMSLCRNAVMANSSFSWWGAWLGDNMWHNMAKRIVFAPKRWFNTPMDTRDLIPTRWQTLEN